ncbi:MAG: type 4a pilus biogenesis protein PilO [Candidatus Aminicenantes bacterium]|nr:type 4a pilus biogenesis protein PilO [Candidatus Aminicenantes bacterium]
MREWPWYSYVLIALIILGLFYFLHYKPKSEDLNTTREERIRTEAEIVKLRAQKEKMDKIEKEIESMKSTLSELETIIPQKEEISDILRKIQQLAWDSRLSIEKFIPKEDIDKEFYLEKPIAIDITGNYHNLAIFFDRLSNFSRLYNIEDFTIKALRDQSEASTISASSTAATYIFKEAVPEEGEEEGTQNKPGKSQ